MLLGVFVILLLGTLFALAVMWLVKTESKLNNMQSKRLEIVRNELKQQYCDEWLPLIYDAERPHYNSGLPAPFHIKNILTVDRTRKSFELYTVMPKGDVTHRSVPFSLATIDLPTNKNDFRLGLNIKKVAFINAEFIRSGEAITNDIKKQHPSIVQEFSIALTNIISS